MGRGYSFDVIRARMLYNNLALKEGMGVIHKPASDEPWVRFTLTTRSPRRARAIPGKSSHTAHTSQHWPSRLTKGSSTRFALAQSAPAMGLKLICTHVVRITVLICHCARVVLVSVVKIEPLTVGKWLMIVVSVRPATSKWIKRAVRVPARPLFKGNYIGIYRIKKKYPGRAIAENNCNFWTMAEVIHYRRLNKGPHSILFCLA